MMKANLWKHAALAAAWIAVAAGCATDDWAEESPVRQEDNNAPRSVLHVSTPADNDPQTRVGYNDNTLKLTWQAGDQLWVTSRDYDGTPDWYRRSLYTCTSIGTPDATSGEFTGTPPETTGNNQYNIYYPTSAYNDYAEFALPKQTQAADGSTGHLKDAIVLTATGITDLSSHISLRMESCIMKFALSGIPAAVGKLKMLQWSASGLPTQTLYFEDNAINFGSSKSNLTAYLGFMPTTLKADGNFAVTLIGDKTYYATLTSNGGKDYVAGSRYTATISQGWKAAPSDDSYQTAWANMKFKIKINPSSGTAFSIPFPTSGITPASIKVDWGDGDITTVPQGTPLSADDQFKHMYASGGEKAITLYSDQTDATRQQIPEINFDKNRPGNNSYLTSIETALLNTGTTDFSYCFFNCTALATIPKELFSANKQATDFSGCFQSCTELTAIPGELFSANKQATNFSYCFRSCTALTAIPGELFSTNTEATHFSDCFNGCTALTTIPQGLFNNNTEATNFKYCFSGCTKATLNKNIFSNTGSTDRFAGKKMYFSYCFRNAGSDNTATPGPAPELWNYNRGGSTWTTTDCFKGAQFTNNATTDGYTSEVTTAWGTPKTSQ